jgi:uncharacterized protein
MKPRITDPRRLDVAAFARAEGVLEGELPAADLPRLAASALPADDGVAVPPVRWRAEGSLRPVTGGEPEFWLRLEAEGSVRLQCQRCLQPVAEPLAVDRRFRFVRGEDEAARLDEELEDDVLALERSFDVVELLEDELLLALPLVPRHETCPQPLPMAAQPVEPARDERPHPFAALQALRKDRTPG